MHEARLDDDGREESRWIRVCGLSALSSRSIVPSTVEGQQIVLISDGHHIIAAERACPHEGADLSRGWCAPGRLFCPRHQAWFDLADGTVSPGWFFRALALFPAKIVGDDVFVSYEAND